DSGVRFFAETLTYGMYARAIGKKSALLSQHLRRQTNPGFFK
ncbi:MAG: hypothetical protein ACI822_001656, partial [Gammaproteobacteria bacterium]